MKLKKYLTTNKMTYSDMAEKLGLSISSVHHFCVGKRIPCRKTMRKIYKVTDKQVEPNDFYDLKQE